MFHHIFIYLAFRQKYSAAHRIFNSLLSVWKCDETLSLVFDIKLIITYSKGCKLQGCHKAPATLQDNNLFEHFWGLETGRDKWKKEWSLQKRVVYFQNTVLLQVTSNLFDNPDSVPDINNGNRTEWSPIQSVTI